MYVNKRKFHSLSRRIVLLFCIFTLVISVVYSLISFVLMYTLEDSFIEKGIVNEADYLSATYERTGTWPKTRSSNMQLHFSKSTLPKDIRSIAIEEPLRKEFFGLEGRHYHLHHVEKHPNVFLIAEVSEQLLVRPIRGGVIQFLLVSAILISTLACLIAWFIGRKTTKPLQQLATLVEDVAPEDLPEKFAQKFPNNEVGILARTLEDTLDKITQALQREKSFTRDVSHELRTPLAVIKNAIELCRARPQQPTADTAVLERIFDATDQMEKTVQTLLMLAREEHSHIKSNSTPLMPIVEKAILDNRILIEHKSLVVDIQDNCHVNIDADANVLKVVLDNLISNAFKYTESGVVKIAFTNNTLIIQDTGPGIDPAISDQVTEIGIKGQQSTGFGFGLSIVKRLCESQGWFMAVNSDSGTTVTLNFSS